MPTEVSKLTPSTAAELAESAAAEVITKEGPMDKPPHRNNQEPEIAGACFLICIMIGIAAGLYKLIGPAKELLKTWGVV
jgi:hypothetical protein